MSGNHVEQDITAAEPDILTPDGLKGKLEDENSLGKDVKFYPPLYMQRYSYTANILEKHNVEWVVDFGCSECGIVRFYREVPTLQKIQLVDIDRETLEFHKNCIKPHASDYIFKRDNPLSIEIYEGSAVDLDQRVTGCDAVSMIEFIEHLVPDILVQVEETVFGRLHPFLVIVTTPNFEFNSLFPGELRFRHFDHKFEWTRSEFQKWCQDICDKYRYSVEFSGVGDPPDESPQFGYCSQAAIFTSSSQSKPAVDSDGNCYHLVAQSVFPHRDKELLSPEERLKLEVSYTINLLKQSRLESQCDGEQDQSDREQDQSDRDHDQSDWDQDQSDRQCDRDHDQSDWQCDRDQDQSDRDQDKDQMEISIKQLMSFSKISKLVNADKLREFLQENGYQFTEDQTKIIIPLEEKLEDEYDSDEEYEYEDDAEQFNQNFQQTGSMFADVSDTEESWD